LNLQRCGLKSVDFKLQNYLLKVTEADLSFNKLSTLKFIQKLPNCKKLSIANNKIKEVDELYALKYSLVEYLDIDRNPLIS
jgi:Leucine-rich repeat (LRR) protein